MDKRLNLFGSTSRRGAVPRVMFVDPGLGGTGWAFFWNIQRMEKPIAPGVHGCFRSCQRESWLASAHSLGAMLAAQLKACNAANVVLEMPELWTSAKSIASATHKARKGDPGDLFKLVYLVGVLGSAAVSSVGCQPILISPQDWKGQLTKDMVHERIRKALARDFAEHEADAVGMGLSAQGKL